MPANLENSAVATGLKRSVFIPISKKAMSKNVQTTTQLHSSHMLVKWCSKFSKPGFNSTWTVKFQMFKLALEKAEKPEIKWPTSVGSSKTQESSIYFFFIDYAKAFDCVDNNKLWKIFKEMEIPAHLTCLLRHLYAGQEVTVRTGHGTTDWFQIGKGFVKAVYCHFAYLTYMQSTSCKMPGWMKHKLESRLPGETSITSDMQMTPH